MVRPDEFAARMDALGPWGRGRRVAVAVSGGADSLCLALLAKSWGDPTGLIVDHGLRPESSAEAAEAACRLAEMGIPARILHVSGLAPGPGLAARARSARYSALDDAAGALGLSDLLLGHHASDQAETVLIRNAAGSGQAGLAAMPLLAHRHGLRLVRPLLGVAPGRLRETLESAGIRWTEDPSNHSPAALRTRLRALLDDAQGDGARVAALAAAARAAGAARALADERLAETLARRATLMPEGYALLTDGPIASDCLAALIRMLGGNPYPSAPRAVARLAANPRPATLGGVRLLRAGRLGPGLLLVREAAGMGKPVRAANGAVWDSRFRLSGAGDPPPEAMIGALGAGAARLRHLSPLPAAVLQTLPAIRLGAEICAVPHLDCFTGWTNPRLRLTFLPPQPAAGAVWMGDAQAARCHHVPV